jgi:hypothetical protein
MGCSPPRHHSTSLSARGSRSSQSATPTTTTTTRHSSLDHRPTHSLTHDPPPFLFSQPKSSVTQHPRKWLAQIHRGQPRETMCEVSIVPILYDTRTHAAAAEASAALSQPHCLIFCRAPCFVSSSSSLNACLCSPAPHTHLVSASPLLTHTLSLLPRVSLAAHSHLVSAPQSTPCRRVTFFASHWCLHSPQATSCRSAAVLVEPFVERTTSSRAILPHACLCSPSAHTHLDKLTRNPPTRLSLLPFCPHAPCLRSPPTPRRRVTFFASHWCLHSPQAIGL